MGLQRRQHIDGGLAHQRVVDLLGDLARADKALALQYRQLLGESGLAELAVSQQLPDSLLPSTSWQSTSRRSG